MAFRRHFSRVGSAERCTETIFTDHQRQVCDYALVYAEKKNDGEAPYSVSFTATQSGDVIVQLHPHSQLERAGLHAQGEAHELPHGKRLLGMRRLTPVGIPFLQASHISTDDRVFGRGEDVLVRFGTS